MKAPSGKCGNCAYLLSSGKCPLANMEALEKKISATGVSAPRYIQLSQR